MSDSVQITATSRKQMTNHFYFVVFNLVLIYKLYHRFQVI